MDIKNKFDTAIDARFKRIDGEQTDIIYGNTGKTPDDVRDALVFTVDTLDTCWKGAQAIFDDKATPEHALQIFDRVISRLDAPHFERRKKHQEQEARAFWEDHFQKEKEQSGSCKRITVEELLALQDANATPLSER